MSELLISMENIKKYYNGVSIINELDFSVYSGEIQSIVGLNGSGKTTLMKILSKEIPADAGEVKYFDSGKRCEEIKVELISHENCLIQEFNAYENMYINQEKLKKIGFISYIDWHRMKKSAVEIFRKYDFDININKKMKYVNFSKQKIIEIIIAVERGAKCIVLDEPALIMDSYDSERLKSLLVKLKKEGLAIVYVSHNYSGLANISDRVGVLVNGKIETDIKKKCTDSLDVYKFMISKNKHHRYPKRTFKLGRKVLEVLDFEGRSFRNVSFSVNQGEIIGFAGLKGSHSTDIVKSLFGLRPSKGKIYIDGKEVKINNTEQALRNKLCYIGSVIEEHGLFLDSKVYDNISAVGIKDILALNTVTRKKIAEYYMNLLNINPELPSLTTRKFSLGNKKKILIAKWLITNSRIYIFNYPTASLDASSKVDIYNLISELAYSGASIIIVSNDQQELLGMCDRLYIVNKGEIVKEVEAKNVTEVQLNEYIRE